MSLLSESRFAMFFLGWASIYFTHTLKAYFTDIGATIQNASETIVKTLCVISRVHSLLESQQN